MSYRYIPDYLENVVDDFGDYSDSFGNQAESLNRQANRFNLQANLLNRLSGNFADTGNAINEVALNNLVKYGSVNENDLVGRAATDNTLSYQKAWDAAQRNLTRSGINPNSGRFAGMSQSFALNRAAAEAGARNQARLQARNENFQRANTMAGLGYNYNSLGLNAANSATSALSGATNALNSGTSAMNYAANNDRLQASMLSQLDAANRQRSLYNDQVAYGRQLLGNNWNGTNTQALAAAAGFPIKTK